MKRKVRFLYAGQGGRPVYVLGYLTDEHDGSPPGALLFEVTAAEPEPRPKPGLYAAQDLPGGWMTLMPRDESSSKDEDRPVIQAARAAGFALRERG